MTDKDLADRKSVCPEDMTQINLVPTWPKPKVRAQGVVKDKNGNIKHKFIIKED